MMALQQGVVTQAHQRTYDDPIVVKMGAVVRITERELWNDDERYAWIWCINAEGKAGWVPEQFIDVQGERGTAKLDYNAIELTVAKGETVQVMEEANGWYWVKATEERAGWVPTTHITLL